METGMTEKLPAILDEIASIEQAMRDAPRAYFRDEPLQARYRGLVALARDGGPGVAGSDGDLAEANRPLVPILPLAEFAAEGGPPDYYPAYLKLARTAADWILALPPGEQRGFVREFDLLPDEVGVAAIHEIRAHRPVVEPVSDEGLASFAVRPEGGALVREWGGRAALNLATVRERLWRVIDRIPDDAVPHFVGWLDGLSTPCTVALYRKLVV